MDGERKLWAVVLVSDADGMRYEVRKGGERYDGTFDTARQAQRIADTLNGVERRKGRRA